MDLKEKHEKYLYPVVRIFSEKAAGSGTVIHCSEDPKNPDEFLTFCLTNHHVVEDLLSVKDGWDSVLKKNRKMEFKKEARVELFQYVRTSTMDSSNRYRATVECYDKHHDIAIIKLSSPRKVDYVAPLIPKDRIKDLRLYMNVAVTGCSLAHEPFTNFGQLTYLSENIEQKQYFMTNASSLFGNSGGALFLAEGNEHLDDCTGCLIGIPSRITGLQLGFGIDIITWMGFAAHSSRLYEFLEEQHFDFIWDSSKTYYDALEARKKKERESLLELKAEVVRETEEASTE